MLEWLADRRMMIDFAHMNAPTFWDAVKKIQGPLIISHGNACVLCKNPRNYTDEQLKCVAEHNGVVGVFFAKTYVTGRTLPGSVKDAANHIDHLRKIMGIDHVALGTDFGGIISGTLENLEKVTQLPNLWEELTQRGYTEEMIEKIAWRNARRALNEVL